MFTKAEYKEELRKCSKRIEKQRGEINRLQARIDKLKAGNIFGCFIDAIDDFRKKFSIGYVMHGGNNCPCCGNKLMVKLTYQYDKSNGDGIDDGGKVTITSVNFQEVIL